jgi:hypothetical protein
MPGTAISPALPAALQAYRGQGNIKGYLRRFSFTSFTDIGITFRGFNLL